MLFVILLSAINALVATLAWVLFDSGESMLYGMLIAIFLALLAIWWEVRDANY